ncbi:MAG: hypothetical protein IK134_08655 [Oscillospiraceae bacterium]|nr:hypothetical protein [Oscillospiraceae bacterium]
MEIRELDYNDVNSVLNLLKGKYYISGSCGPMDCVPDEYPVDRMLILHRCVYTHPAQKDIFQQAMLKLGGGNAGDVYTCVRYFYNCLKCENGHDYVKATFQLDKQLFIPLLVKQIKRYNKELRGKILLPNGETVLNPMETIERLSEKNQSKYGFSLV